jgi:hypothetical protein
MSSVEVYNVGDGSSPNEFSGPNSGIVAARQIQSVRLKYQWLPCQVLGSWGGSGESPSAPRLVTPACSLESHASILNRLRHTKLGQGGFAVDRINYAEMSYPSSS